jgi:hypothetical protein
VPIGKFLTILKWEWYNWVKRWKDEEDTVRLAFKMGVYGIREDLSLKV